MQTSPPHINQTALAKVVGVDKAHINRILHGSRRPTLLLAKRIADALNITLDEFYNMVQMPNELPCRKGAKLVLRTRKWWIINDRELLPEKYRIWDYDSVAIQRDVDAGEDIPGVTVWAYMPIALVAKCDAMQREEGNEMPKMPESR